ncbi:two component, sigma54 specific, transcriptional regulator, Fis family [Neorhodopirellula lusitana]|uniref:Two component, sigma54 specific, transcriptional regulator, Fis family n=1 Tax=Neorhodopirellula lusitana TaxID=445327 RepID=A0ABY1PNW9_9BACT|nr:sigma-54 dependent transcriptional regulator [Neorhodopirellula lusitana]SMP38987.1 two component, sigma54 specific, transcriptional regulator, Fis family [Neorhodopirellula lusitana]
MNPKQRILIADDEPLYRETTAELLRDEGYECVCVEDADDAIGVLKQNLFDLILSDLNMPGNLRLELLREGRTQYAHIPMIVVTGVPSIPSAIESVRLGIADYLLKPVKFDELLAAVQRALRHPQPTIRSDSVSTPAPGLRTKFSEVIGESQPMLELLDIVDRVAASNTNVLLTGESGTGKEVIAKAIHQHSTRRENTIQIIDCTAIPESLFESVLFGHVKGAFTSAVQDQAGLLRACDGGTAFFDELGELPPSSQAKLLRVIQDQTFTPVGDNQLVQVDTRFICATNRDLQAEVDAGHFRQDLFYRLAVIHIELPPLRQRGNDVLLLADTFLQQLKPANSPISGFSPETQDCFLRYPWPGNIRELRNVVERSIALASDDVIQISDLPPLLRDSSDKQPNIDLAEVSRDEALDRADQAYLTQLLEKHAGVIASASRQAGLSRQGMNKLLKRHEIDANDYRK